MPAAVPKISTVCEVCATVFERSPAFHRSAEAKGGKVRFCSRKCYGTAKSSGGVVVTPFKPKVVFTCEVCQQPFGRWPSFIRFTEAKGQPIRYCSRSCQGKARTARLTILPGQTSETARKISDAHRAAWGLPPHDDLMMSLPKKVRGRLTRGVGFNASQLRRWLGTECARCGATDNLRLDHIKCMAAGGQSVRENAQTLCDSCNRWKRKHVDKPLVRQQSQSGGEG